MPMKIVSIGCLHGRFDKKLSDLISSEAPDAILVSGDFSGGDFSDDLRKYEKGLVDRFGPISELWPLKVQVESEKKFRKWSRESASNTEKVFQSLRALGIPVYYIHGNWDSVSMGMGSMFEGSGHFFVDDQDGGDMHFIHGKVARVKGFDIVGFGGYRGTSSKEYLYRDLPKPWPEQSFMVSLRDQMRIEMDRLFSKVRDNRKAILLTHDPPYRMFDYLESAKKNYGEKVTREAIERHSPALCVCSHFHEHQGAGRLKNTVVVNSGYGHDGQCAVIEMGDRPDVRLVKP